MSDGASVDATSVCVAVDASAVVDNRGGTGESEGEVEAPPPPEQLLTMPTIATNTIMTQNHARFQIGGLDIGGFPPECGGVGIDGSLSGA